MTENRKKYGPKADEKLDKTNCRFEKQIALEDEPTNFRSKDGKPYVVRCPKCHRENYAPAVGSGQCVWCGWKE